MTADTRYNAFPGLTKLPGDRLLLVYFKGQGHTGPGSIYQRVSADKGTSWSPEQFVHTGTSQGLTRLSDGTVVLTLTTAPGRNAIRGGNTNPVHVMRSVDDGATWREPIQLPSSFTQFASLGAPVVELRDGSLILPFYGRNLGDTFNTARLMTSTDRGATWGNETTIASGQRDQLSYSEPNVVRPKDGSLLALIRSDTVHHFFASRSQDGGATWSVPVPKFYGTGAPRLIALNSGTLGVAYRSALSTPNLAWRVSADSGATWSGEALLERSRETMEYAAPVQLAEGVVGLAYGVQASLTASEIRFLSISIGD